MEETAMPKTIQHPDTSARHEMLSMLQAGRDVQSGDRSKQQRTSG